MILGRQPEKDGRRDSARFVVALHFQKRGEFNEREQRSARKSDLLAGDDRERFSVRPAANVIFDVQSPSFIGGDERVDECGGRPPSAAQDS